MIPCWPTTTGANAPGFYVDFASGSLVPVRGGVSPTFTRATVATVLAYAPAATASDSLLVTSVASGEARFTGLRRVSEGVWSPYFADGSLIPAATRKGYLAEGAGTNRCLHSQAFDNAVWAATNVTKAANEAVAPDGTTTADTLTATAGNGTVIQDLGVVASAAKSGALWIKRKTGTGNIDLTLDGGATWTTQAVTTTWTRFSITQTLANEDFGIRIVTSGDAVWVWQGQVETASFNSSDIVTTTAAVTRNADVLTYPFITGLAAAGTAFAELSALWATAPTGGSDAISFAAGTGSPTLGVAAGAAATTIQVVDGTNIVTKSGLTSLQTAMRKRASSWGAAGLVATGDGASVASGSFDGAMASSAIGVGCNAAGTGQLFGNIASVALYTRQLTNAQLQGLTT